MAELRLELPAHVNSIPRARAAARDYAERLGADPEDVALAVSEATTNALVHGYRDGAEGSIVLAAKPNGEALLVVVEDSGVGVSPHPEAAGLRLGLPIIGQLADEVELVSRDDGGTRIRMRFPFVRRR